MSGTMYRRPMPSLLELALGGGDTGVPPQPAPTPQPEPAGPNLQDLLAQAFAPPDMGPEPQVFQQGMTGRIAGGLGDALSRYAAAYGGGAPTNYGAQDRIRTERDTERRDEFRQKKALVGARSQQDKAQYLLGQQQTKEERALAATVEKAKAEQAKQNLIETRQYNEGQAKLAREQDLADQAAKDAVAEKRQKAEFTHDEAMARLRSSLDPSAKDDLKGLSEGKADANEIANNIDKLLAGYDQKDKQGNVIGKVPPQTPDQIRKVFRRNASTLNLGKDAYEALMAYFEQEVESELANTESGYRLDVPGGAEVGIPRRR